MQTRLELYQRVIPLAGLGIFERNLITGEVYWNQIIRRILEVDNDFEPVIEKMPQFFQHPGLLEKLIKTAMVSCEAETETLEVTTANGNHKWVKIHLQADCEDGKCVKVYGTAEDVTSYVRMAVRLKEREKRFTKAFDHAPIGMALVAPEGRWIKVNESLCKLLGYSEQEFLKHTFQDYTHPDDLKKDLEQLGELVKGVIESYSIEKRYFHASGEIIWAILNVSLVLDDSRQPLYFISQIRDITQRKRNSEIINSQNSRLLNFAHIVSHNLRSHTGNMQMLTEMILLEDVPQERNQLLKMLKENSGNLMETLGQLSEIVKVQDGGQMNKIPLNLKQTVVRVLDILSASIKEANTEVSVEIPEELLIEFNPAYLESIILNLLSNSLKYRDAVRRLIVEITAKHNGEYIEVEVKDNGRGIDLSRHGHEMFGMYKTFHGHPDARGMGLYLVKNQVEAMEGNIHVKSKVDIGTTFTIEFR
ncbi:PAS domain S-box protein [Mucilaginibacter sp.]|uniref:sensor histidine kinase n=1 Tax=Mucilaginibacter sp. TaxID=1882438 RepID=UPI0035BC8570